MVKYLLGQSIAVMVAIITAGFFGVAMARVSGPCENCHTMHNREEGGTDGTLVVSGCVGCHSSSISSTYYVLGEVRVPVVYFTGGAPPDEYLAGGNFWWVKEGKGGDDRKGHNVFLNEEDDFHTEKAPGEDIASGCGTNSCHANLHLPFDGPDLGYTPPGRYGCEGCHLNVRHHAEDHPNGEGGLVTTKEQGWYRFLSGHEFIGSGVEGYEDDDWEAGHPNLPRGSADHNEYRGSASGYLLGSVPTTTAFCKGCHTDFHTQRSGEAWIRHPSDAVIPNYGEYADIGGENHLYDPLSPAAKAAVDDTPDSNVGLDSDMVMCLSCHRPHGSPYPDMLRWDYLSYETQGGGNDEGCFYCHTKKNDIEP